jgi:hypothetical protein
MKKIILSLLILFSLTVSAADEFWAMKTQTGELVKLSDVSYILETDGAKTFSIVCSSSTINDVTGVTFVKTTAAGITSTAVSKEENQIISNQIGNELILIGASLGAPISVFSLSGAKEMNDKVSGQETHINVSNLVKGIHVLKVGNTSVKFLKK